MKPKKLNRKEWERLNRLLAQMTEHYDDPAKQSFMIFRGDFRAIQWACWWIRESNTAVAPLPSDTERP